MYTLQLFTFPQRFPTGFFILILLLLLLFSVFALIKNLFQDREIKCLKHIAIAQ